MDSSSLAAYVLLFLAVGAGFVLVNLLVGKLIRPHRPDREKGTVYECGEPTIGSAWVQFDLRYYVIALLFVIFDVEVAFFFPWAEVFGKANAVVEAGPPTSPEAIHELAHLALPLTAVPDSSRPTDRSLSEVARAEHSPLRAVRTWGRLQGVEEKDFERYKDLQDGRQRRAILAGNTWSLAAQAQCRQSVSAGPLPYMLGVVATASTVSAEAEEFRRLASLLAWEPQRPSGDAPKQGAAGFVYEEAKNLRWLAFVEILVFFGVLLVGFAYLWRRGDLAWVRSLPERQAAAREPAVVATVVESPIVPVAPTGIQG